MEIIKITQNRERYLPLLLLADEQYDMLLKYLHRGDMYAMHEGGAAVAVCIVTDEGGGAAEIKNLAVAPKYRRTGCGRRMVEFIKGVCRGTHSRLQVGTGDSPETLPFYESCGFQRSHVVKGFFTEYYDHPIYEGGRQLVDMVYLRMSLKKVK